MGQLALVLIVALAFATFSAASTATSKRSSSSTVKGTSKTKKAANHSSKTTSHAKTRGRRGRSVARKSWKSKGQHGISSDRAREIQEALIREHYLDGQPTGAWDSRTQEACRRYQADNGWQSKVLPDSRLLIKLGLGPDHSKVLNPETAATSPYLPGGGEKTSNAMAPATASVPQQ